MVPEGLHHLAFHLPEIRFIRFLFFFWCAQRYHFWLLVRGAVAVAFVVGSPVRQRVFLHLGPRGEGRNQEGQRQPPEVGPVKVGGVVVVVVLSFIVLLLLLVLLLVLETVVLNVKIRRVCENIFFLHFYFSRLATVVLVLIFVVVFGTPLAVLSLSLLLFILLLLLLSSSSSFPLSAVEHLNNIEIMSVQDRAEIKFR